MEFEPIILRYDGLAADQHRIDLGQVGASLQGAAQLLGTAGTVALTGEYAKRSPALSVRVYAGIPNHACWELPAIIVSIMPPLVPMFPTIADITRKAATKAVTSIVNYAVATIAGKKSETVAAMETVQKAMAEVGHTSRHAMDVVERIAANNRPSIRLLVTPVGTACETMRIGKPADGAIQIDQEMRAAIDAPDPIQISPAKQFDVLLSELDLKNGSCKFALRDSDDPDHRVIGDITDPLIYVPDNPYSQALSSQRWLSVTAKAEIKDGELTKLFISDVAKR